MENYNCTNWKFNENSCLYQQKGINDIINVTKCVGDREDDCDDDSDDGSEDDSDDDDGNKLTMHTSNSEYPHGAEFPDFVLNQQEGEEHQETSVICSTNQLRPRTCKQVP